MAVKATVYVETSIISYLTARPSKDVVIAAHQKLTRAWWKDRRHAFDLYTSDLVIDEATQGDAKAATARSKALAEIARLEATADVAILARRLLDSGSLPAKAAADAVHIAVATCHGIDYLLTWNCKHIANAELRTRIEAVCQRAGFDPPILTTPEELMGTPR